MFKNVTIIGDGAMGTVLAMLLCDKGINTTLWGYDAEQLGRFEAGRENVTFLPGYALPDTLIFEAGDDRALKDAELIVSAVPCQFVRSIWTRLKPHVRAGVPVMSVAKGIENKTLLRPTEVLANVLEGASPCGVLSGPTIADELAHQLPATACVACEDNTLLQHMQVTFNTDWFRVYSNTDLIGVELAGACKNVIAIAAGAIDGIGAGDNAKAALLSRGLAEIMRLGVACGAKAETFAGLAGLGDLVTTCISPKGRNRSFGERIGRGDTVEQALGATKSVVEGAATCQSLVELARSKHIEMPITESVYQVLFLNKPVQAAIQGLMRRELKSE
ncbi:MAG: NAD(P)-dependent glycerol-3-phosphate dehydrogenase [Planctomycetes bacterium]|nr:NAD(P)-dependent glycerol-3-phosphate dehydrogenase [Planctomycetota bacterium]